jgi:hypothetical protein
MRTVHNKSYSRITFYFLLTNWLNAKPYNQKGPKTTNHPSDTHSIQSYPSMYPSHQFNWPTRPTHSSWWSIAHLPEARPAHVHLSSPIHPSMQSLRQLPTTPTAAICQSHPCYHTSHPICPSIPPTYHNKEMYVTSWFLVCQMMIVVDGNFVLNSKPVAT